jgi:hypothetical protein
VEGTLPRYLGRIAKGIIRTSGGPQSPQRIPLGQSAYEVADMRSTCPHWGQTTSTAAARRSFTRRRRGAPGRSVVLRSNRDRRSTEARRPNAGCDRKFMDSIVGGGRCVCFCGDLAGRFDARLSGAQPASLFRTFDSSSGELPREQPLSPLRRHRQLRRRTYMSWALAASAHVVLLPYKEGWTRPDARAMPVK